MLEHLRADYIPEEYILNRYSKGETMRHTFNMADYKTVAYVVSQIAYKHNKILQLAFRLVRSSSKSDEQRTRAKVGLLELIDQVEAMDCSTAGSDEEEDEIPDFSQFEPNLQNLFTNNEQSEAQLDSRNIHPPPISKTKGSGSQAKGKVGAQPQPSGKDDAKLAPGIRNCGRCGKFQRHNSRSCPLLKKLAADHTDTE